MDSHVTFSDNGSRSIITESGTDGLSPSPSKRCRISMPILEPEWWPQGVAAPRRQMNKHLDAFRRQIIRNFMLDQVETPLKFGKVAGPQWLEAVVTHLRKFKGCGGSVETDDILYWIRYDEELSETFCMVYYKPPIKEGPVSKPVVATSSSEDASSSDSHASLFIPVRKKRSQPRPTAAQSIVKYLNPNRTPVLRLVRLKNMGLGIVPKYPEDKHPKVFKILPEPGANQVLPPAPVEAVPPAQQVNQVPPPGSVSQASAPAEISVQGLRVEIGTINLHAPANFPGGTLRLSLTFIPAVGLDNSGLSILPVGAVEQGPQLQ